MIFVIIVLCAHIISTPPTVQTVCVITYETIRKQEAVDNFELIKKNVSIATGQAVIEFELGEKTRTFLCECTQFSAFKLQSKQIIKSYVENMWLNNKVRY